MAEAQQASSPQQAGKPQEKGKPQQQPQPQTVQQPQAPQQFFDGYKAEIMEILPGRTGMFGSVKRVMCKVLEGKDKGRVIRRNIIGRVKQGDVIRISDTSREDRDIKVK